MKKLLTIGTTVFILCSVSAAFALPTIPSSVKVKAQTAFSKIYTPMKKDVDIVKIQKLKSELLKITGKQEVYKKLNTYNEAIKNLILGKIEEINKGNVTTYPNCDKKDIAIGRQVWSSCNVGSNEAGTGSESTGDYFAFGTWTTIQNLDLKKYANGNKIKWNEKTQWVCASGYHIPTSTEFKELFSYFGCQDVWSTSKSYNRVCGKNVVDSLLLPTTGWYFTDKGYIDDYTSRLWTSSEKNKSNAFRLNIDVNSDDYFYGDATISYGLKAYAAPVRCIKD